MKTDRAKKPSIANIRKRLVSGDVALGEAADPVKLYLREMGGITLLTRKDETEIAKEKGSDR